MRQEAALLCEARDSAELTNAIGLHARPSVKLTQVAKGFGATIEIATAPDGPWTDAKSIVKIMRIKAAQGETLFVRALGADAASAVTAVADLIRRNFDED
jgi:phosphocarrier protein HPr